MQSFRSVSIFFLTCLYKVAIVNQVNLVSIRTSDPHLPGTFYLTKDGNWSPDKNKAQRIPDQQIPTIMRQLKGFSKRVRIVVEDLQSK